MLPTYPPATANRYRPLLDAMITRLGSVQGIPAATVAEAVSRALTAKKPRTRYVVGLDARIGMWMERLPDRWRDRLVLSRVPRYGGEA